MPEQASPPQANNLTLVITAGVFFALGFLIAYVLFVEDGLRSSEDTEQRVMDAVQGTFTALTPSPTPHPTAVPVEQTYTDENPLQGNADAPVMMVEFASYTCEFCGAFRREVLPALQQHYGDLLAFVSRDFPRGNVEFQLNVAAACAQQQDAFWVYTNQFWMNQVVRQPLDIFEETTLLTFADAVDLDTDAFATCLDDTATFAAVQRDLSAGRRFGVVATPTFFINGQRVLGSLPFEAYADIIDAELEAQGITPPPRL